MNPAAGTHDETYCIVEFDAREAHRTPELRELLARCEHADQRPPLGDHAISALATIEPTARAITVVGPSSLLAAYAQATPTSAASPTWTIDIAVDPSHRHDHDTIIDIALRAALGWVRERSGSDVQWWRHEPTDNDHTIAERHGLLPKRLLLQMQTRLDSIPADPSITIRPFMAGIDELALLDVNNLAFAHHPDQGDWTHDSLISRFTSDWFDPAGLLIHTDDHGTMLGFCWTKIHHAASASPLGEIYVIAVRPSHHGRGLGRALTRAGLASLHERDIDRVMLFVDGTNTAARTLYQQLGFAVSATSAAFHAALPHSPPSYSPPGELHHDVHGSVSEPSR